MSTFAHSRSIGLSRSQLLILGIGSFFAFAAFAFPHSAFAATTTVDITANATWVAPDGVTTVYVEAWGGGGGGGGGANGACCGGGGGGGAYARSVVAVTPGNPYTVVVGAGGAAGASTPTSGGTGGDSMFSASSTILAKGGIGGGTGANGAGGAGGSGSTGSEATFTGGTGGNGISNTSSGAGGGAAGDANNGGNASGLNVGVGGLTGGGDGAPGNGTGSNLGITATSTGGGGSGGTRTGGAAKAGGAGYRGLVRVSYESQPSTSLISLDGYIFENDDATSTPDTNTQQAAASTSITSVTPGERLTLRAQIQNTGARATSTYALFYDRNDGIFTRVRANAMATTSNGDCADPNWECDFLWSISTSTFRTASIAIDPLGNPWITFATPYTVDLTVARYVGSGGSGCGNSAWICTTIDTANNAGAESRIVFDQSGVPWIAYYESSLIDLRVARYVGSGGTGCADAAWTCTTIDSAQSTGVAISMAIDSSGNPWIAYHRGSGQDLMVARYVGTGGTGCDTTEWTCVAVDTANSTGTYTSIAFDQDGNPWISYIDSTTDDLRVARYVGSAGSGCASSEWTCTTIAGDGVVTGRRTWIAFDPSGRAWISYLDGVFPYVIKVARYVGTGGTGCDLSTEWTCTVVDETYSFDFDATITFDVAGNPWLTYNASSSAFYPRVAHYVGSGGSGCGFSSVWTCTTIDSGNASKNSMLAFDHDGTAWMIYVDRVESELFLARTNRGGEILIGAGFAGTTTTAITQSHADMLSATDSANRNDADCLASGATWANGTWFDTEKGTYVIPSGAATPTCTELAFVLDTSQASSSQTYRFVLATEDGVRYLSPWRGPTGGASSTFPTITTGSAPTQRIFKDTQLQLPPCNVSGWGCKTIDYNGFTIAYESAAAIDPQGNIWVVHQDSSNSQLRVVHHVGSGGTGCLDSAWTCEVFDSGSDVGGTSKYSIGFDSAGDAWISYHDSGTNNDLRVAHYVGSGGSGCSDSSAWMCYTVATTNSVGRYSSLAVDSLGNPWVSYYDASGPALNLLVAHYVGSGGTGCADAAWTCVAVDTTNDVGQNNAIEIDAYGNPWISYYDLTNLDLRVARYVGIGGSGCADPAWICTTVDSTDSSGIYSDVAFDASGAAWVSYFEDVNDLVRVARYVGSGGTGCTDSAWTCTTVTAARLGTGRRVPIVFDPSGQAWLNYHHSTTTADGGGYYLARYVGTGGTGCTSSAWTCTKIYEINIGGSASDLVFDSSGNPWVAFRESGFGFLKAAYAPGKPTYSTVLPNHSHTDKIGRLRYVLDIGKSPRTDADGTCNANTDRKGYCGVQADDTHSDTMSGIASSSPLYTGSFRHTNNTDAPTLSWLGQSNIAPSSKAITMQIYHFGTVNAWEDVTLTTNTCSSAGANTDCTLVGATSTNLSEYYEADGSYYWMHVRVYQASSDASPTALKTDLFSFSAGGGAAPNLVLTHARFRNDDGTESQATFSIAEDATLSGSLWVGDRTRLRWLVSNTGSDDATNYQFQLQYGSSSCTAWSSLGDTKEWTPDLSQWVPNGAATTNVAGALTDPGGKDFVAGRVMAGTSTSEQLSITTTQFMELEYIIRSTALVQELVTYCFRLTNLESTTNFTYTAVPQAILTNRPRPPVGGAGAEGNGQGNQRQGGGASGGAGAGGEGSGSGGTQTGGGAGGGGDSG